MTRHYRWDTTLDERRDADPGIDDPARRAAARDARNARDIGYHLAHLRKQQGMTQAQVAATIGVSQVRVSRMEHGNLEKNAGRIHCRLRGRHRRAPAPRRRLRRGALSRNRAMAWSAIRRRSAS